MSKLLRVEEVADLLQLKVATVREYIRNNELEAIKLGREYRVSEDKLKQFLKERSTVN